jgi:hypothetical protein
MSVNRLSLATIAGVVTVCAWLVALPSTAVAQDDAFKQGLEARGDRRWPEAAAAMRRAIQADSRESTRRVRTGLLGAFGGGTEYFPYFFLGEALKNQGDCAGAVSAWEISEDQKAVLGHTQYAGDLRAGYKECAAKGVLLRTDFRQQVSAVDQAYNDARGLAERLNTVKGSNPDLWRPDMDADFERARGELGTAQGRIVKARETRLMADFNESRSATARAVGLLRPIETRLGAAINARTLLAQQAQEIQQVLSAAEANDRAIDAVKVALPAALASSRDGARAQIAKARDRLAQAEKGQNTAMAGEAMKLAQDASEVLAKALEQVNKLARGEFEQRFQQVVAAASEQFSFFASSFATLERLVAEKPDQMLPEMSAEREALQKEQSTLQRRFDSARRSENVTAVQDVTRLASETRMRVDALIKAFGPATLRDRGVHAGLEEGARLYFDGEYQRALDSLSPLAGQSDVPLQVHVHLFRAAALYALYVRSGESDAALLTEAQAAIGRSKQIDPSFEPSSRAFSPRFIGVFRSTPSP